MPNTFPSFTYLPLELQLLVIDFSDTRTCTQLLQSNHDLRAKTVYCLQKSVSHKISQMHNQFLLSFYSPNNKESSTEKFYYQAEITTSQNSESHGLPNVSVNLKDLVLSKNLFDNSEKKAVIANRLQQTQMTTDQIPLLINEESPTFKATVSLVLKNNQSLSSRTALSQFSQKFYKSNNTGSPVEKSTNFYKLHYTLHKQGTEPPRHEYDFDLFDNFLFSIKSIDFNCCYILHQLETLAS
ncbi:hypothetical protein DASC09_014850 [Saccharomycopsis crataegensis]|uniref:Uncharacterized protein n=1 Tax=Saccharomycopsis crataegensis TaxID=43959 RepID=A0AAV5QIF0_9ASCO|nr:hypothetical protein DASC09_014850 [Saccharomycopsis crataegensis]